ncbi:hypothetical protein ACIPEQ_03960 [Curtobacterium sp. NPDC087080]|uniref:hypothetical protein n=1 Tax=Curtobacterium sp. NPDC087080 TaxID=3363965 RepID=UPI0038277C28
MNIERRGEQQGGEAAAILLICGHCGLAGDVKALTKDLGMRALVFGDIRIEEAPEPT